MNYGQFDLKSKEYIITRPDTPEPWVNYLGSPEYGAIISNNAEGYSFVKSGANGRISRFRFNSRMALPGRFIYVRDNDENNYWSASWQPVGKPLNEYKSECRHGLAYTVIDSEYKEIKTSTVYYVPLNQSYEVWRCTVTNNSDKERNLSLFGFIEFTNDSNYEQDQVNLQYTQFITRTSFEKNKIIEHINEYEKQKKDGTNGKERFFGMTGAKVTGFCGMLDNFIGLYRTYSNPLAVENGECDNSLNFCGNCCGALQSKITLKAGESISVAYFLGQKNSSEADRIIKKYSNIKKCDSEIDELKKFWNDKLKNFEVKTPDEKFNNMINVWNAYQCFITFIWSRAASFTYCGLRNGYGYRDTVQDIQGIIHLAPEMAVEKIRFMLSAQVDNGGGLPLVKFTHNAGHENTPDDESYAKETGHPSYRADDALWLFPTICKYISETGNIKFLDEEIPFANKDTATVYEHLKRAILFSMERLGKHDLPAGLHADWNDCLRLGKKGETTFVAFQLYYAMKVLLNYAKDRKDYEYVEYLEGIKNNLSDALEKCWEGDQFIRGIREDGVVVGSKKDKEANIWLEPQCWSVISGFADNERGQTAMETVNKKLNTEYGARIFTPPYKHYAFDGALMQVYNPSVKENGGIFSQPQGWAILAEAFLGNGNRAYEYFKETSPAYFNNRAEIRGIEPYVHGQFTESVESPFEGRSHVNWLTGTASTVMVGCVEGILGIRPGVNGLFVNPSIPSEWDEVLIKKRFRDKSLSIKINNKDHKESGVRKIYVNGHEIEGDCIKEEILLKNNEIEVIM